MSEADKLRFAVTLINERAQEKYVVVVELSEAERAEAVEAAMMNPFGVRQGENVYWRPLVNLYASNRALAGLPPGDEWSVPYSEIVRIQLH